MSFASNFVIVAVLVVGLLRRRAVRALATQGILRDVVAMPRRLERVAQFGIVLGCVLSVLRWTGAADLLHMPGIGRIVASNPAMVVAFAFIGTANLLDLLRVRAIGESDAREQGNRA